jgi:hypothetical protein
MLRAITVSALVAAILVSLPAPAQAAPKTIAIVNLSTQASAADEAAAVRQLLDRNEALRPTTPGDLARSLEDALPEGGPDAETIAEAREDIAKGIAAFTAFKSREARSHLERARAELFALPPSADANQLLADVSFNMALIHMRAENNGLAIGELQLLHRLVDRKAIDPVRYPPDVVRAFNQARTSASGKTTSSVSISATDDGVPVFLDGVAAGFTPVTLPVSPGAHVVAIAAPQYQANAILIDIDPGAAQAHRIDLRPRDQVVRARELRFEAKQKGLHDDDLREAASRVARLVGSDAVLVLVDGPGVGNAAPAAAAVLATLYIQHLDKLSYRQPINKNLQYMFGLVTDVARPTIIDGIRDLGPVPLYKKPWVVAVTGGGIALIVVGIISASTGDDSNPPRNGVTILFPEQ